MVVGERPRDGGTCLLLGAPWSGLLLDAPLSPGAEVSVGLSRRTILSTPRCRTANRLAYAGRALSGFRASGFTIVAALRRGSCSPEVLDTIFPGQESRAAGI